MPTKRDMRKSRKKHCRLIMLPPSQFKQQNEKQNREQVGGWGGLHFPGECWSEPGCVLGTVLS